MRNLFGADPLDASGKCAERPGFEGKVRGPGLGVHRLLLIATERTEPQ